MGNSILHKPIVCLDRDDTLNIDSGYIKDPQQIQLIPGVREALLKLFNAQYPLFLITNQSGIDRGLVTVDELRAVHQRLFELLFPVVFVGVYFCRHLPDAHCACRKPKPGLILDAMAFWKSQKGPSLAPGLPENPQCFMVGDRLIDTQAGKAAAAHCVLVPAGHKGIQIAQDPHADFIAHNLNEAVEWILHQK
jgi:D,D-heptose 1,7-bisphosphate phosphatase